MPKARPSRPDEPPRETDPPETPEPAEHGALQRLEGITKVLPRLPFRVRVGIFIVGWILILVGIAGLILPGIQGIFTIVTGAALLSLDNDLMYRLLRRLLARWPHLWERVERLREKTHDKLHRLFHPGEK